MQPSNTCNFSPCQQHDTHLSEQRRKFIAKHRAEQQQEMQLFTTSPSKQDPIDRIHRHSRQNLSGKIIMSAVKPRRRSKHEHHAASKHQIPEFSTSSRRTSSMMYRRGSMRAVPQREANLDDEFLAKSTSCRGLNGGSGRLDRRKGQTKSIVLTNTIATVVTPQSSPRPMRRRRSDIGIINLFQSEHEQTLISAFQSKLGMGW